MSCFPCFGRKNEEDDDDENHKNANVAAPKKAAKVTLEEITPEHIESTEFKFRDLAAASKNFRPDLLLGEGGLGRVYKGCLESNKQVVAIKQLDRHSVQNNKEFLMDVMKLSVLNHANLVNLVGFCADGEQRLLVYEYFPLGSLDHHLLDLDPDQRPMNWQTRMKIAHGIAQGLEYLHETADPPVIFGNLKSANVLLDDQYNARLSDFGLSRSGPKGEKTHLGMMEGTYGYCAPEYERTGQLTVKADVYSFGVVILELITGRRAIDTTKDVEQQNLVSWALPIAKDQKRLPELVDPLMNQDYPVKSLNQAVAIANMCLQEEPTVRPMIADISMALSFLSMDIPAMPGNSNPPPI